MTTAESLKARFTMPYAGQYVLGGSLSHLNEFRSVIPMNDVIRRFYDSSVTTPISLMPFAEFDLSRLEVSNEWQEPPKSVYESYVEKISLNRFPYQRIEAPWSEGQITLTRSLQNVTREFQSFVDDGGAGSNSSITIKAGDVFGVLNFGKE